MKPYLFLDVDGVLSPLSDDPNDEWDDWLENNLTPFWLLLSKKMGISIRALNVDIVWLTTWEHDANFYIGPIFDWPNLPVLESNYAEDERSNYEWWKLASLRKFLNENPRDFIWIDDEIQFYGDEMDEWLGDFSYHHHLISPNPNIGLQKIHIDNLVNWLRRTY